ncbi:hypothetical protein CP533_5763 [Ophiocordyceps camponoti-saundersi (nom. inval.)]|nr:hypothetical protein CP533_5763 [Ophiocordyceps camponoti-saundersi (nom. inval.)]
MPAGPSRVSRLKSYLTAKIVEPTRKVVSEYYSPRIAGRRRRGLLRQRPGSHLLGSLQCGVSTDEAGGVNEDAARYAGDIAEVLVAHTAPGLGEWLAADEGDVKHTGLGGGVLEREKVIFPGRRKQVVTVKDE